MPSPPTRGPAVRELGLPLPPDPMPLLRGRRPLKRWRYVGVYGPELMLCAVEAAIGPARQRFWGIGEPDGRLVEGRKLFGSGGLDLADGVLKLDGGGWSHRDPGNASRNGRDRAEASGHARGSAAAGDGTGPNSRAAAGGRVRIDLALDTEVGPAAVESVSPNGAGGYVWTRKLAGARAVGTVAVDGEVRSVDAEAVIDDTAGYHARHTEWRWSAGVGRGAGGERIGWNLVEGVNDDPEDSERTLWVDGEATEAPPARFAADLSAIDFSGGGRLRFRPWATLAHRTRLGVVRSNYRQPFGTFAGELPGGLVLSEGYGVMEHHDAWW